MTREPGAETGRPRLRLMQMLVTTGEGGAERFFERLAPALARRGVEQRIVLGPGQRRAEALRAAGCEVLELPFGGWRDPFARWRLARAVRAFGPDVVMVWMNRAARRAPRGRFATVGRLGGYYPLRYYRRCDALIANTPDLANYMTAEGWPASRVHMISNFVDLPPAPPLAPEAIWGAGGAVRILALGRLHPMKGFDTLIDAVARLPDARLAIAGEGALRGDLEAQVARLGLAARVRFLGWRDDQAALLAAADLLCVPSRHEPLGNVVLEAWAAGVPVVAAASEGPRWLIEDGVDGLLAPIDDAAALAQRIARLAATPDLAARLVAAGRESYRARFSEAAICDQYLALFHGLAASRGAGNNTSLRPAQR